MFPNTTAPMAPDHYTLSLHDALPISARSGADAGSTGTRVECSRDPRTALGEEHQRAGNQCRLCRARFFHRLPYREDRKSTRLNSSHVAISYAVFCLKKKKDDSIRHLD